MKKGKQKKSKRITSETEPNTEILEAKAALHEAAKALAELVKEEPKSVDYPRPPRTIHVYPTGISEVDIANLESAITDAGPGGIVVLKAMDKTGRMTHFNLTKVDELFMIHEITLKSEKNAVMRFSE